MFDLLIQCKAIVTMDASKNVFNDGYIAIKDGKINEIGSGSCDGVHARETIRMPFGLAMPGMIDGHFHTTQHFLRSKPQFLANKGYLRLPVWKKFFVPFEYSLTQEEAYWSAMGAYMNLIHNGTTSFADAGGVHPSALVQALLESGIRGNLAVSTMDGLEIDGVGALTTDKALSETQKLLDCCSKANSSRIKGWTAIRQITTSTDDLLREIEAMACEYDTRVHIHLAEGAFEIDHCLERLGVRPVFFLEEKGLLNHRLHAAHVSMITDEEMRHLKKADVSCVHCASSNFTLFEKPKVPQMRQMGIRMGIGSDGASHGSTDLLKEAKISYVGQISHFGAAYYDRHVVSDYDMVSMATIEGARALGMEQEIGSLEVGKRADIIMFSLKDPDVWPCYDPYYAIARCLSGGKTDTVVVDGQVIMKDAQIRAFDEESVWEKMILMADSMADRGISSSWK